MTDTEKMEFKVAISKIPGMPDLSKIIDAMSSEFDLQAMEVAIDTAPGLTLEFDDFDFDFADVQVHLPSSPSDDYIPMPRPIPSGTTSITIRVQNKVLAAMKAQASKKCVGYQTHINRVLKAAVAS